MSTQQKKQSWRDLRNKILDLKGDYESKHGRPPTQIAFTLEDKYTILEAPETDIGKEWYAKILTKGVNAVTSVEAMQVISWTAAATAVSEQLDTVNGS